MKNSMIRLLAALLIGLSLGAACAQESESELENLAITLNLLGSLSGDSCTGPGELPTDSALGGSVNVTLGGGYYKFTGGFSDPYVDLLWVNGKIQSSGIAGANRIAKLSQEWQGYDSYCGYLIGCSVAYLNETGRNYLSGAAGANDIVVYEGDVYILGALDTGGYPYSSPDVPGYWKNTVWTPLPQLPGATAGEAYAMEPVGTSLYINGRQIVSGNTVYGYWADGTWHTLPDSRTGIGVENGNVYVAGQDSIFKNDQYLYRGNSTIRYQDMRVRNGDVYATAVVDGKPNYSVNGRFTPVADCGGASMGTFIVVDSDIYIAGTNGGYPGFWKNEHWYAVEPFQSSPSRAWSIYVEKK